MLGGCGPRSAEALPVLMTLHHRLGAAPLNVASPTAPATDLAVTRLSYYLGQFRLQRPDGTWIGSARRDEPEGDYVQVDLARPSTLRFEALRAPPGDYRALEFLVGIDARRNHAGAQTGALDPERGLFWTWHSGYIFFALEGRSPASGARDHSLTYHVGGDDALARTVVLPLSLHVRDDVASVPLDVRVDLDAFFQGLPLERTHTVMNAQDATPLADRFADLFTVAPPRAGAELRTARAR